MRDRNFNFSMRSNHRFYRSTNNRYRNRPYENPRENIVVQPASDNQVQEIAAPNNEPETMPISWDELIKKEPCEPTTSNGATLVVPEVQDISDSSEDEDDSIGDLSESEIQEANDVLGRMMEDINEVGQNLNQDMIQALDDIPVAVNNNVPENIEVVPDIPELETSQEDDMPALEHDVSVDSNEGNVFEPHSPPHSPPEHQDEGVQDLQFIDDLDQHELGQVEELELDEDEMLQFRQTAWENLTANRSNYSSKPYESSYNYDNLKDWKSLSRLMITTSTLAGCNNTAGGKNRIHSIEMRGGRICQILDAVRTELGSWPIHPRMKIIIIAGLNDLNKFNFNIHRTIDKYWELQRYLKSLNQYNHFVGLPIPPKMSSLMNDDHIVLMERTLEILHLNDEFQHNLSDHPTDLSMQELGIVSTHTGEIDTYAGYGKVHTIGARHKMHMWREANPAKKMHLTDRVRRQFFREKIVPFFAN